MPIWRRARNLAQGNIIERDGDKATVRGVVMRPAQRQIEVWFLDDHGTVVLDWDEGVKVVGFDDNAPYEDDIA